MADFFDTSAQADLNLLHESIRTHSELDNVVDKVEWEIINAFTERDMQGLGTYQAFFEYENGNNPNSDLEVRLVGYDATTPADSDANLKQAMRRTIADMASWALRNYTNSNNIESIRQGQRSVTYAGYVPVYNDWPPGWDRRLSNFDARFKQYGI